MYWHASDQAAMNPKLSIPRSVLRFSLKIEKAVYFQHARHWLGNTQTYSCITYPPHPIQDVLCCYTIHRKGDILYIRFLQNPKL